MPSKRSKSQERERKKRQRAKMSEMERAKILIIDKERRREARNNQGEEEKERILNIDKQRRREARNKQNIEMKEYEKILCKHQRRNLRSKRSGKDKLKENLRSKKGMRLLCEEGRLLPFTERIRQNTSEVNDWKNYMEKSVSRADIVEKSRPDIVEQLNKEARERREEEKLQEEKDKNEEKIRQEKIEREGGEWVYNPEYAEYYWSGEKEPAFIDDGPELLTEQELFDIQRQEEKMLEVMKEEMKDRANEKRRERYRKQREAMSSPVKPFPCKDLCEYEKLRENNIREREKAMIEAGFYDDYYKYKKDIGLLK